MYTYYIYICILLYYHCYVIYCSIHIIPYHVVSCIMYQHGRAAAVPCPVNCCDPPWRSVISAPASKSGNHGEHEITLWLNMDKYHVTYEHSWDIRTFVKPLDASGKYGHLVNNWL